MLLRQLVRQVPVMVCPLFLGSKKAPTLVWIEASRL